MNDDLRAEALQRAAIMEDEAAHLNRQADIDALNSAAALLRRLAAALPQSAGGEWPGGWPDPERPGVPLNPERDGTHWLVGWGSTLFAAEWRADDGSGVGYYAWPGGDDTPGGVVAQGWSYAGPCLIPTEVAGLVAEARREGMREAAKIADRWKEHAVRHKHEAAGESLVEPYWGAKAEMCHTLACAIRAAAEGGGR